MIAAVEEHNVKSYLSLLLIVIIGLEGCYSYADVSKEEQQPLMQDSSSDIEITLKDGSKLKSYAYHYLAIAEPSDVVSGIGEKIDMATGESSSFKGKFQYTRVDSGTRYEKRGLGGKAQIPYYDVWLSNSVKVRFDREECVIARVMEGSGFWLTGYTDSTNFASVLLGPLAPSRKIERFSQRIPFEEIASVGVWKVSAAKSLLCAAAIAAGLSVFIATKAFHATNGQ